MIRRGYTIIELLIVIVIMSLISGIGFATYRDYQKRQEVVNVARQLESDIRLTQESAQAGIKPETGCTVLDGYAFRVTQLTQSYYITPYCSGSEYPSHTKNVSLPSGISIDVDPDMPVWNPPLVFKSLAQGTNMDAVTNPQYQFTIFRGGYSILCDLLPWLPWCRAYTQPIQIFVRSTGEIY